MKLFRRITVFLAALLLMIPPAASAYPPSDEKTDVRYLIEFEELATKRLLELGEVMKAEDGYTLDFCPIQYTLRPDLFEKPCIQSSFGSIELNMEDFTISSITMTLYSDSPKSGDETETAMKMFAAMSVLEYDDLDERLLKLGSKYGLSSSKSALDKIIELWDTEILPKFSEIAENNLELIESPKRWLAYSGNYDYFISYVYIEPNTVEGIDDGMNYFAIQAAKR